jgi:CRP/FNR family transcriptional regulator
MTNEIENYLSFYKNLVPEFTNEELNFIKPYLQVKVLNKGDFYLQQGQVQQNLGFVSLGLIRQYYNDTQGKEITVRFNSENTFCADYNAFVLQTASHYNLKCLEKTTIMELSYNRIQEGYLKYKNYERFGRLIAEKVLSERQKKIESLLFEKAEKRYLNFLNTNQELSKRISISHLASFLGIERQSLTRIRKKILG